MIVNIDCTKHEGNTMKINSMNEYRLAYDESIAHPDIFWGRVADSFTWKQRWSKVRSGDYHQVNYTWFDGAKLNITENCLDRHLLALGEQTAYIWEPNDPKEAVRHISYNDLHNMVCRLANGLSAMGVKKGDRVCIYMPMVPELAVSLLACARIGAIHSVVFGGFSAQAIADRVNDADCHWMITADGVYRGDKKLVLKSIVDEALERCPGVRHVVVLNHRNFDITMYPKRDIWWHDVIEHQSETHDAVAMDAEDPLFILYTSGSTGKPKGVLHTTAGYMVYAGYTFANVFQYQHDDIYWCTADIGWITGHSYMVYGPLLCGATSVLFEGVPSYPDWGRLWDVVDKHRVTIFYTAPTAIRALEAQGLEHFKGKSLSSLRVLGSVGEPINEEAWNWYHENVGHQRCPIVDTWWQTETGGILIAPLAGITPTKPSFATLPLPGVIPVLVDAQGNELLEKNAEGNLCIKQSWPGQARSVYGDHDRFISTYFATYKGLYFTGDGCRRDDDGYYRITGRVDDVINVSGHRIGTAEVENAIDEHENIYECAVVGIPHAIKGQCLFAFVACHHQPQNMTALSKEIHKLVSEKIGSFARPDYICAVSGLPKTRSGKIMRRIIRKIAEGEPDKIGDITTLLNPEVVEEIKIKVAEVIKAPVS
jgi:acetyl-CoA synthetase